MSKLRILENWWWHSFSPTLKAWTNEDSNPEDRFSLVLPLVLFSGVGGPPILISAICFIYSLIRMLISPRKILKQTTSRMRLTKYIVTFWSVKIIHKLSNYTIISMEWRIKALMQKIFFKSQHVFIIKSQWATIPATYIVKSHMKNPHIT